MATSADIAASLTMDDIPVKLRCAACNKLANNAFRMPCCDQSICEDCQASLPEACPVCLHEPVKADDCRPNKALRTTIKVFLKKKVMERETARKKETLDKAAATPATTATPVLNQAPAPQPSQIPASASSAILEDDTIARQVSRDPSQAPLASKTSPDIPSESQKDVPQLSIESPGIEMPRRDSTQTAGDGSAGQEKGNENEKPSEQQQQPLGQNEQWASMSSLGQGINNGSFGFDGTNGFPNMGFNGVGDLSQMMQSMPNAMFNPMMGSFPNMMAGMPGMGMDPMTMSSGMYGGFGGQGMGMNGMNMGMGFDAGQGAFGGFNGQPAAWNASQNKFNQNAYGGHAGMGGSGGDFGANAGYGGYNVPPHQGNYNQMHHPQYPNNDFHQGHHGPGFQSRGRGRGRGYQYAGRGRGGYHQNQLSQGNSQTNYEAFHEQVPPQITRRGSPQYGEKQEQPSQPQQDPADAKGQQNAKSEDAADGLTAEERLEKELAPGDAEDDVEDVRTKAIKEDMSPSLAEPAATESKASDQPDAEVAPVKEEEKPSPIETFISDETSKPEPPSMTESNAPAPSSMMPPPIIPTGPAADLSLDMSPRSRGAGRGFHRGDYRAGTHSRGAGHISNINFPHIQATPPVVKPVVAPVIPKGLGVEGAPTGPKALREGQQHAAVKGFSIVGRASAAAQSRPNGNAANRSPSRDRSRSPSKYQSSHHRHRRHRSSSPSEDNEHDKRRERHRRHSRKYDDDDDDSRETKESRTRDVSPDSPAKRSSHRGSRHHDRDKDIERGSHRSHRHRSRSKDREEEIRSSKKRSPSPELTINGASRKDSTPLNPPSSRHKARDDEAAPSSRKRRSDDEDHHRDRKRSRKDPDADPEEKENGHRSRHSKREDKESRSNHDRPRQPEKPVVDQDAETSLCPPKGPKIDQHALEREKRNAERIARENQRRALQAGSGGAVAKGAKVNGQGRRMSYKYEDDESTEARTSRNESEREATRYR